MGAAVGAGTAGQRPMPSAANAQNAAEDAVHKSDAGLGGDRKPQEPAAQKTDADEPVPGSIRDAAQEKQAEAENLTPPPEPPSGAPEESMHTGPLPDLRQGLPSTFDLEFGGKGLKKDSAAASEAADGTDMTASSSPDQGSRERREREEREYQQSDYETSLDRSRARMANIMYAVLLSGFASTLIYTSRPFPSNAEIPLASLQRMPKAGVLPACTDASAPVRQPGRLLHGADLPKLLPEVPEAQRPPFTLVLSLEDLLIHSSWDRTNGYNPLAIADPVIKKLDPYHFILWPLGREATKYEGGEYIKDLSYLNRDLKKTLIIDTHART
ncbi:hypothetical protein BTJ68_09721 [Hortaea werneckii EXF-2000]|uniref:FCP1 homology domain-containing protein n=1 Tax=Hortaea werneckii EXF-2000 TaxID=1157616 RepID=A0A1Z5T701_HORWE|nr:hypothetical protein BTJ68_09721 [Hortaea werneckii EXF-2000]